MEEHTDNKAAVLAGLRDLIRVVESGEASPYEYMLFGEIGMWWRLRLEGKLK